VFIQLSCSGLNSLVGARLELVTTDTFGFVADVWAFDRNGSG